MAGRTRLPSTRDGGMRGPSGGPGILGPFAAQQQQQHQVRAAIVAQQQQQAQIQHHQQQVPPPPDLQRNFVKSEYVNGPPPTAILDHTIQAQQNEIRLLLTENQHLADAHVALRQELLAAQQEGQRMQALLAGVQSEKDGQVRALLENSAKLEADLRANEPLKVELQQARFETKRYTALMHELQQQLRNVNTDLHRFRTETQQIPALKAEIESLRQDVQRTRTAYEYEKSVNSQYVEQKQLAEKNLVAMAREVESLRAELTTLERRGRFPPAGYDGISPVADGGYGRQQRLCSNLRCARFFSMDL
ncbi:unnamed protein product [Calypogeia fissa]